MITVKDVAREAGVSISTVSNVLNNVDKVSDATRQKVLAVVERLQFVPNVNARSLKSGKRNVVGMFLSSIQGAFYTTLAQAVHLQCKQAGYMLNIYVGNDNSEADLYAMIASSGVASAIIMNGGLSDEYIDKLRAVGVPLVFLDKECAARGVSCVLIDNYAGVSMGMEYLVRQGHRRIGYIQGLKNHDGTERYRAYCDIMNKYRFPIDEDIVLEGFFEDAIAYSEMRRLFIRGVRLPDAFYCANDEMAWGCIRALRGNGVSVPEQVSVMGFDDIDMSAYYTPPLTTLHSPVMEVGRQSAQEALRLAADADAMGSVIKMEPTLVVRESCAPRIAASEFAY